MAMPLVCKNATRWGRYGYVVSLLLSLAACSAPPKTRLIEVSLALPVPSSMPNLPILLAQSLGYYEQEGIRVTINDVPGGAKALEALLGGSVATASAMFEEVVHATAHGRELRAFVTTGTAPALALVVSPGGARKISRIEDLRGAVVAVTSPGSPTHLLLNYLLAKHGMKPEDVSVIGLGPVAARLAALEHGTVAAAMLGEPAVTMLLRRHPDTTLLAQMFTEDDLRQVFGTGSYTGVVLFSTPKWLSENPAAARGLAYAIQRSLTWMHSHSPAQIRAQAPQNAQPEDAGVYEESIRHMLPAWSHDGVIAAEGVAGVWKILSASDAGVRDSNLDLKKTYTNRFLTVN